MNTTNQCEQLDDYLDGDLAPEEASRFREHVEVCGECQANLDAMAEFDGLVAEAKLAFDDWYAVGAEDGKQNAIPALEIGKQDAYPTSVASRFLTSVAVVAATIAIVFVARSIANRPRVNSIPREIARSRSVDSSSSNGDAIDVNDSDQLKKAIIRMSDDSAYLAEPIESSNPNITIYWLHPTVDAQKVGDNIDSSSIPEQETSLLARRTL